MAAAGVEPIVLQPLGFDGTSLTRVLYRGCRWEAYSDAGEAVAAALQLSRPARRLVTLYLPQVDFAAHVGGQCSKMYATALREVAGIWQRVADRLPAGVVMVMASSESPVWASWSTRRPVFARP